MSIVLSDYPVVIEPTTEACEVRLGGGDGTFKTWKQIPRVPTKQVIQTISGIPLNVVHFFGVTKDLSDNDWLIGYDTGGLLSVFIMNRHDSWELEMMPQEATGNAITHPSLRMTFKDERARAAFVHYLEQVATGNVHNPDVALMLERTTEPIKLITVWSESG